MGKLFSFLWFFWLSKMFVAVSCQCLEDQRSLLLQLKQGLSMDPLPNSKLRTWNSTNCCLWDGVNCDLGTRHVIGLDLSNSAITGGINSSSSLFSLQHLQQLNLAYNRLFTSAIPLGFGKLSSLTHLNLSYSGFVGQVPLDIASLRMLVSLDLSNRYQFLGMEFIKLQNPDLETLIKNLSSLRELHLDGIDISMVANSWDHILSSTLSNLRVLSLNCCNLVGKIQPSLSKLQLLTHLDLGANNFSRPTLNFFTNFTSLTSLCLSSCGLSGRFPIDVIMMPMLHSLDISDNVHLFGSLPEFPPNNALRVINLSGTMLSGKLLESINNLAFLQNLHLRNCRFFGSIPSSIESLTELVFLDLSRNHFSGPIPLLASSKKIITLILSHNGFTGTIPMSYGEKLKDLEILDLRNNSLQGMIPSSLFTNHAIKTLDLGQNQLNGQLKEFENASSSLRVVDLSQNQLQGPIPMSIFKLKGLNVLSLSSNFFNGTLTLDVFKDFKELTGLDLSHNNLSVNVSRGNSTIFSNIRKFGLSSCSLDEFPNFLRKNKYMSWLDLSNNRLKGEIPKWIWKLGADNLVHLNLSHNILDGYEEPGFDLSSSSLVVLDLHSNMLQGPLLIPPPYIVFLDYSNNNFTSTIPSKIFNLFYAIFVSFSNNSLGGEVPPSICSVGYLQVLDLSSNNLNGSIPQCLGSIGSLKVLKLRNNGFQKKIPQMFGEECSLRTLDLNQNHLEGPLPRSLANCGNLEVLDVGNNRMNGSFPLWLEELPQLRVLILRSNNFGGPIQHVQAENVFPMLQIIDLSSNKFHGKLPSKWFQSWKRMMNEANDSQLHHLRFNFLELSELYYQDSVTLMNKGLSMELVKILTIFTSVDLSNNQFEGEIPEEIRDLEALYVLNMSRNLLTGQVPSSFEKLKDLESLDLSQNKLSGNIPQQLNLLTFLSFLNLSQNLLVGEIPRGRQFETFTEASYEGNIGLCGPPLSKPCSDSRPPATLTNTSAETTQSTWGIDWDFFWIGFGCGEGLGVVVGVILGFVTAGVILGRRGRRVHKNIPQLGTK